MQGFSAPTSALAQRTLSQRIESAAKRVCSPLESRMIAVHRGWRACIEQAVREARDELVLAGVVQLRDDGLSLGED